MNFRRWLLNASEQDVVLIHAKKLPLIREVAHILLISYNSFSQFLSSKLKPLIIFAHISSISMTSNPEACISSSVATNQNYLYLSLHYVENVTHIAYDTSVLPFITFRNLSNNQTYASFISLDTRDIALSLILC